MQLLMNIEHQLPKPFAGEGLLQFASGAGELRQFLPQAFDESLVQRLKLVLQLGVARITHVRLPIWRATGRSVAKGRRASAGRREPPSAAVRPVVRARGGRSAAP